MYLSDVASILERAGIADDNICYCVIIKVYCDIKDDRCFYNVYVFLMSLFTL